MLFRSLRVTRYELREDVCGAGKWRGGLGSIREFTYLKDGGGSIEGEGHKYKPWGFLGGKDGHTAAITLQRADGRTEELPSKMPHTSAETGDKFACIGPAGGAYGHPFERHISPALADVRVELISIATDRTDRS